jgi:hypothetical protein
MLKGVKKVVVTVKYTPDISVLEQSLAIILIHNSNSIIMTIHSNTKTTLDHRVMGA